MGRRWACEWACLADIAGRLPSVAPFVMELTSNKWGSPWHVFSYLVSRSECPEMQFSECFVTSATVILHAKWMSS